MNKMGTVIGFTFVNKVRTKSFIVTTLILAILVTIGLHVPYFIGQFSGNDVKGPAAIGLVYENQPELAASLKAYTEKQQAPGYALVDYKQADEQTIMNDLNAKKIDGYLKFAPKTGGDFPAVTYTSKNSGGDVSLQTFLQAALQHVKTEYITKGSLSDAQIAALNAPVQINMVKSVPEATGKSGQKKEDAGSINFVVVYVLIILFFMTSMMTGNMIAAEVTAEKSSRIMEILISSVSPLAQMFGKIIGMFFIGLLQIGIFVAVVAVNISLPYNQLLLADINLDPAQIQVETLVFGLIFYILGYFLYATLFAAIGSLVSRTEELGQAIMPITMLSLAAFYVGIFSINAPNSMLLKVCAYIPFISPVSMIVRVGIGDAPVWEIAVSVLILGVAIVLFGWLSAKIYRTGVLLYGKRPSFKELRKAMKAYKI